MSFSVSSQSDPTVFSVPFEYLWSTSFTGEMRPQLGAETGLQRFVGDQSNYLLKYLAEDQEENLTLTEMPLVLFGQPGTGKTALAMSLVTRFHPDQSEHQSPLFLTSLDYDRRFRQAMETDSLEDFRHKLLNASGIVIDDLHKLHGKLAVQQELVLLLDLMKEHNVPLILTMDQSPVQSSCLIPRLASRLASGLTLPVYPPGPSARRVVVHDLAVANGIELTLDAIDLIVDRLPVTVPKLNRLFSLIRIGCQHCKPVDASIIATLIQHDDQDLDRMSKTIAKTVADEFNVKVAELKGNSRKQSIVLARSIAIFLNRRLLSISFVRIGSFFGDRDHSTIMHAQRKIESIMAGDSADPNSVRTVVQRLTQGLAEQFAGELHFGG